LALKGNDGVEADWAVSAGGGTEKEGCTEGKGEFDCPGLPKALADADVKEGNPVAWGISMLCRKGLNPVACG
jgi:hypothetical protein